MWHACAQSLHSALLPGLCMMPGLVGAMPQVHPLYIPCAIAHSLLQSNLSASTVLSRTFTSSVWLWLCAEYKMMLTIFVLSYAPQVTNITALSNASFGGLDNYWSIYGTDGVTHDLKSIKPGSIDTGKSACNDDVACQGFSKCGDDLYLKYMKNFHDKCTAYFSKQYAPRNYKEINAHDFILEDTHHYPGGPSRYEEGFLQL